MPGHAAGRIAVADAIGKNHPGGVVAAGEHRRKIAAFVAAGRHRDDIAFQSGQNERAVRSLITGPQLHAAEGPHCRSRAIELLRLDVLELHTCFDA